MTTPIKKKLIANSVNTPSTSAPRIKRRTTSKTNSAAEPADNNKPANDSHCNGATENPVTDQMPAESVHKMNILNRQQNAYHARPRFRLDSVRRYNRAPE